MPLAPCLTIQSDNMAGFFLKHWGVVESPFDCRDSGCGGSARFRAANPLFDESLILKLSKSGGVSPVKVVEKPSRSFKMNAGKVRAKALAYAALRRSRMFLAFYSISFPKGIDDDLCYRILNSSLSQLRKNFGLRSYLWVMERQGNGTVHYHLLTNDYMNVRDVNAIVARSIEFYVLKGLASWGRSSYCTYNGVDVKAVVKKRSASRPPNVKDVSYKVADYLAKYMTKEQGSERHRVWHCSRLVSSLFISCSLNDVEFTELADECNRVGNSWKIVVSESFRFYFFQAISTSWWEATVCRMNERVWDYFERNDCW